MFPTGTISRGVLRMPTPDTAVVNFKLPSELLDDFDRYIADPPGQQLGRLTRTSVLIYLIRQLLTPAS